jgi:hypothetical protein
MAQKCKNCLYGHSVGNPNAVLCCRYPPTIVKVEDQVITSYFPLVNLEAWCGEWKRRRLKNDTSRRTRTVKNSLKYGTQRTATAPNERFPTAMSLLRRAPALDTVGSETDQAIPKT